MAQLAGKAAIVTGGASGIGEACSETLAREGASVLITDIDDALGKAVVARITKAGGKARYLHHDVREEAAWPGVIAEAEKRFGRLDIMVANAGVAMLSPLVATSYEQWREVTSVNLDGVFLCIRYAAPALIAAGGGAIVTMASVTAKAACPLIGSYAAAKAGVVSLTQTAATELRAHNIRVNAILPAFIETDMVKPRKKEFEQMLGIPDFDAVIAQRQGRYGTPQEVANLAVFLASERASFSNGSPFVLDGGVSSSLL